MVRPAPLPAALEPECLLLAAAGAKRARTATSYGSFRAPAAGKLPTCVVLDIEGTVAPIAFVSEVGALLPCPAFSPSIGAARPA